jgi:hypothetical protein
MEDVEEVWLLVELYTVADVLLCDADEVWLPELEVVELELLWKTCQWKAKTNAVIIDGEIQKELLRGDREI